MGGDEGREVMRQSMQDLVGHRENFNFCPE